MPDFRVIPSIEVVRQRPAAHALVRQFGDGAVLGALRESTAALRERLADAVTPVTLTGEDATHWIEQDASTRLRRLTAPSLRPVINATGVIVHTNLGRAPLSPAALARIAEIGAGYSNLEYRPAGGPERLARHTRRVPALPPHGRRSGGGRQQLRGGDDAGVVGAGAGARGGHLARGAGRNRRWVPRARHHGAVRRAAS